MIDRYIHLNRCLRRIHRACQDGIDAAVFGDPYAESAVADFLQRDLRDVRRLWPKELPREVLTRLEKLAADRDHGSYRDIVSEVLPEIEDSVDEYFGADSSGTVALEVIDLLHPRVFEASYGLFRAGRYRDAVLNGIVAVYDMMRERTGLDADGVRLVSEALSLERPMLVLSELETESGRSDQKGFLQVFQGAYVGIRNPKAHTLVSDLTHRNALQYLIFASLLARRVEEASRVA